MLLKFNCHFRKMSTHVFPFDRKLKNNAFNNTLNLGDSISAQLDLVDLENNDISLVTMGYEYKNSLM